MGEIYRQYILPSFLTEYLLEKKTFATLKIVLGFVMVNVFQALPADIAAQNVYSYTYQNVTRNNGGGTLEQGDTIEVRALVKVESITDNLLCTPIWELNLPKTLKRLKCCP